MNQSDRTQQFFKPYLLSASADLALRRLLGNLLNELLITQKSLIDRLVLTLLVTQASSVLNECNSVVFGASLTSDGSKAGPIQSLPHGGCRHRRYCRQYPNRRAW